MVLSETLCSAYNQQIVHELFNANKYSQIESFFEDVQLPNLAKYFRKQSDDEKQHANKFIEHVNTRVGGKVTIEAIDSPNLEFSDFSSIGDIYLKAEQDTTSSIEGIYDLALSEKSYIDLSFIQSMLFEQLEEEQSAQELSVKLKMVKDIVLFDATLGD